MSVHAHGAPAQAGTPHYAQLHPSFRHNRYLIRRKIMALIGAKMHVYDDAMNLLMFCHMKGFKLKEDIRIYADEAMTQPLVAIRARKILDFSSAYDVYDVSTGVEYKVGMLRRKGWQSMLKDEWHICDQNDQQLGTIAEDSMGLALLRRLVGGLIAMLFPQKFLFTLYDRPVGSMQQNFNPFVAKLTADFSEDPMGYFDRRLAAAAAALLCVVEGKQG